MIPREPRIDGQWRIFCFTNGWEAEDALAALAAGLAGPN